jgi:DNA-binding transcriptional MerR regulator
MAKSAEAFRTISEVAEDLGIPKHVLRFWEVKFAQIRPMKRGGGRRYYRPADLELLRGIRNLLHRDGYTIKGVQKILREQGVEAVKQHATQGGALNVAMEGETIAPAEQPDQVDAVTKAQPEKPRELAHKPAAAAGVPRNRSKTLARIVAAAIAELEACRAILEGVPPSAEDGIQRRPRVGGER